MINKNNQSLVCDINGIGDFTNLKRVVKILSIICPYTVYSISTCYYIIIVAYTVAHKYLHHTITTMCIWESAYSTYETKFLVV